jgi:hypothetical protein
MLLHISNITTWRGCIRRTTINHPLNMKIPLGKCPAGLDQNNHEWYQANGQKACAGNK